MESTLPKTQSYDSALEVVLLERIRIKQTERSAVKMPRGRKAKEIA